MNLEFSGVTRASLEKSLVAEATKIGATFNLFGGKAPRGKIIGWLYGRPVDIQASRRCEWIHAATKAAKANSPLGAKVLAVGGFKGGEDIVSYAAS